jgi:hypothetical protein
MLHRKLDFQKCFQIQKMGIDGLKLMYRPVFASRPMAQ